LKDTVKRTVKVKRWILFSFFLFYTIIWFNFLFLFTF
jgi:hypothetical protein